MDFLIFPIFQVVDRLFVFRLKIVLSENITQYIFFQIRNKTSHWDDQRVKLLWQTNKKLFNHIGTHSKDCGWSRKLLLN